LAMGKDELRSLSKNDLVRLILRMQERLAALEARDARISRDCRRPRSCLPESGRQAVNGYRFREVTRQCVGAARCYSSLAFFWADSTLPSATPIAAPI
jgi:hypothetical protein